MVALIFLEYLDVRQNAFSRTSSKEPIITKGNDLYFLIWFTEKKREEPTRETQQRPKNPAE